MLKYALWGILLCLGSPVLIPWRYYQLSRSQNDNIVLTAAKVLSLFLGFSFLVLVGLVVPFCTPSLSWAVATLKAFGSLGLYACPPIIGMIEETTHLFKAREPIVAARCAPYIAPAQTPNGLQSLLGISEQPHQALTEEERSHMEQVLSGAKFHNTNSVLSPHNIAKLATLAARYLELKEKIEAMKEGLKVEVIPEGLNDLSAFDDVETPILLVKEYLNGNTWRAVPAKSHITCREFLAQWYQRQQTHPLTRDSLITPRSEEGIAKNKPVRYRFYELSCEYCWAPELNEIAQQIRALIALPAHKPTSNRFFDFLRYRPDVVTTPVNVPSAP